MFSEAFNYKNSNINEIFDPEMTHHHDQTKVSKVSVDINQYHKDNFEQIADIPYIINNDDIFYYNDWDDK
jgi:hypothetical protein